LSEVGSSSPRMAGWSWRGPFILRWVLRLGSRSVWRAGRSR
jgi:hypothetical protein